jgi:hypothetical protein
MELMHFILLKLFSQLYGPKHVNNRENPPHIHYGPREQVEESLTFFAKVEVAVRITAHGQNNLIRELVNINYYYCNYNYP